MKARALLIASALLLTACGSQRPYNEIGICLTDVGELAQLKTVITRVATQYGSEVDEYSNSASRDLKALDSPIAIEHLFALFLEDPRWQSQAGPVMVNNIGASSAKSVGVSMFRNGDLFGSDRNTERLHHDLISAVSAQWKIIEAPSSNGTYDECFEQP